MFKGFKEHRATPGCKGPKEFRAFKALLVLRECRALRGRRDCRAFKGDKVTPGSKAPAAYHRLLRDRRGTRAFKARLGQQGVLAGSERRVLRVQRQPLQDRRARPAQPDQ